MDKFCNYKISLLDCNMSRHCWKYYPRKYGIGGSRGGREGRTPPPGRPNSFDFMQFSGKFGVFTPPLEGSRPPPSGKSWIRHCTGTYDAPDPALDYIIKPGQANTLRYQVGHLQAHAIKVKTSTYLRSSIGCST